MSPIQSLIAVLFTLASSSALAQNATAPQPPTGKPVNDSATFGPVLHPEAPAATAPPTQATTQAAGEARPQAQEERAGSPPVTGKQNEVDPSARPGAVQQIEGTPRIVVPDPAPVAGAQARVATPPVAPQSSQVVGCMGSSCTDVNGTTYNAGGPGNATVSRDGRLCTRNGATMQCL